MFPCYSLEIASNPIQLQLQLQFAIALASKIHIVKFIQCWCNWHAVLNKKHNHIKHKININKNKLNYKLAKTYLHACKMQFTCEREKKKKTHHKIKPNRTTTVYWLGRCCRSSEKAFQANVQQIFSRKHEVNRNNNIKSHTTKSINTDWRIVQSVFAVLYLVFDAFGVVVIIITEKCNRAMRFPGCAFILADGVARKMTRCYRRWVSSFLMKQKLLDCPHSSSQMSWFCCFFLLVWCFVALFVNLFVVHASLCMPGIKRSLCAVLTAHRTFNHICEDYAWQSMRMHSVFTMLTPNCLNTHEHMSTRAQRRTHTHTQRTHDIYYAMRQNCKRPRLNMNQK